MAPRKPRTKAKAKAPTKHARSRKARASAKPAATRRKSRNREPNDAPALAKMGRPRKDFSRKEFEKLCRVQSTKEEIAAWFDVSEDTIERRVVEEYGAPFAVVFRRYRGSGKVSLRRKQFQKALEGDSRMLKFLGANWLGQRERVEYLSSEEARLALAESLGVSPDDLPDAGATAPAT